MGTLPPNPRPFLDLSEFFKGSQVGKSLKKAKKGRGKPDAIDNTIIKIFLDVLHTESNALVSSFQGSLDPGYAGGSGLLLLCPQVCS